LATGMARTAWPASIQRNNDDRLRALVPRAAADGGGPRALIGGAGTARDARRAMWIDIEILCPAFGGARVMPCLASGRILAGRAAVRRLCHREARCTACSHRQKQNQARN
jgi:hypothetical protein